jgi:single-strand DNA-binding protein
MSATSTYIGNLTRDPEVRFANSGQPFCSFSIAVNKNKKNSAGEWEKETSYFDCVVFGESAENFANSFGKGNRVIVTGRLQQRKYEGQDGTEKTKIELVTDEIGATVKYATVAITRTERPEGQNGGDSFNRKDSAPATARFEADFGNDPF